MYEESIAYNPQNIPTVQNATLPPLTKDNILQFEPLSPTLPPISPPYSITSYTDLNDDADSDDAKTIRPSSPITNYPDDDNDNDNPSMMDIDTIIESRIKALSHAEVNTTIRRAAVSLNFHENTKAHSEALDALEKVTSLGLDICIAKAKYWLGRVAYYRHRDDEACRLFNEAAPVLEGEKQISLEKQEVGVYLGLFGRGVSEEERERVLGRSFRPVLFGHGRGPSKQKGNEGSCDGVWC